MILLFALLLATALATPLPSVEAMEAAWQDERYITLRRMAEERLAADADDLDALLMYGFALHWGEGDLGRARAALEQLGRTFERKHDPTDPDGPWQLHATGLRALASVAGAMDDRQAQLDAMDRYDRWYTPKHTTGRIWPLMKLERYQDALDIANEALAGDPPWSERRDFATGEALNGRCAVYGEWGRRLAYQEACLEHLDWRVQWGHDVSVAAYNAALGAMSALDLREAERIASLAARSGGVDTSNPYILLVEIQLAQGRGAEAAQSALAMQRWRLQQPPSLRDEGRARIDLTLARLMLAGGHDDQAWRVADRAVRFPDRLGYTSAAADQTAAAAAVMRHAARRLRAAREAERRVTAPWHVRLRAWLRSWLPDPGAIEDRATVASVIATPKRASGLFRPYLFDGLPHLSPWLLGEVIPMVGAGVARASLAEARELDSEPEFQGFHDAFEAEIAWWSGAYGEARRLGTRASAALPDTEALLRARTLGLVADAAWRQGDVTEALRRFEEVLAVDPSVLRRLGLRLPARVQVAGGGALAAEVGDALSRSPRLVRSGGGFEVRVEPRPGGLAVCLRSPAGGLITCPVAQAEGDAPLTAADVADVFHRDAFGMGLGLSTVSLRGLDGTTIVAREAAARQVEALLGELDAP